MFLRSRNSNDLLQFPTVNHNRIRFDLWQFCIFVIGGRLVALGSGHMFADKYIDQEKNDKLREMIFDFLSASGSIKIITSDHDDIDVSKI